MTSQRLPFENRWTNNTNALQWNCELEHLFQPALSGIGWRSMIALRHANSYFGAPP